MENINAWIFIFNKIQRCFCCLKYIKWLKENLTAWCTKQTTLLDEKQGFTELRGICKMVGEWGKPTCQPCGLVMICWKQSHKLKTVVWKWLITTGWNPKHRSSTLFPCYNIFLFNSKSWKFLEEGHIVVLWISTSVSGYMQIHGITFRFLRGNAQGSTEWERYDIHISQEPFGHSASVNCFSKYVVMWRSLGHVVVKYVWLGTVLQDK